MKRDLQILTAEVGRLGFKLPNLQIFNIYSLLPIMALFFIPAKHNWLILMFSLSKRSMADSLADIPILF